MDKTNSADPIVSYVDAQLELFLQEELKLRRSFAVTGSGWCGGAAGGIAPVCGISAEKPAHEKGHEKNGIAGSGSGSGAGSGLLNGSNVSNVFEDSRVHCCFYFIAPTGHTLKALDLITMKRLHTKVNIVPIIAKADTITPSEMQKFKTRVHTSLTSIHFKNPAAMTWNSQANYSFV